MTVAECDMDEFGEQAKGLKNMLFISAGAGLFGYDLKSALSLVKDKMTLPSARLSPCQVALH